MFGRRRKRLRRCYEEGQRDGLREECRNAERRAGVRVGDDTEPVDLLPDERAAYWDGRRSSR